MDYNEIWSTQPLILFCLQASGCFCWSKVFPRVSSWLDISLWKHAGEIPKQPQLAPFDIEYQRLYLQPLLNN